MGASRPRVRHPHGGVGFTILANALRSTKFLYTWFSSIAPRLNAVVPIRYSDDAVLVFDRRRCANGSTSSQPLCQVGFPPSEKPLVPFQGFGRGPLRVPVTIAPARSFCGSPTTGVGRSRGTVR